MGIFAAPPRIAILAALVLAGSSIVHAQSLAIADATVYKSATAPPLRHATVLLL